MVTKHEKPAMDLEHGNLPDPVAEAIRLVLKDQHKLEERLERLEYSAGIMATHDKPIDNNIRKGRSQ